VEVNPDVLCDMAWQWGIPLPSSVKAGSSTVVLAGKKKWPESGNLKLCLC